jgi:hypothetical protein
VKAHDVPGVPTFAAVAPGRPGRIWLHLGPISHELTVGQVLCVLDVLGQVLVDRSGGSYVPPAVLTNGGIR